MNAILPEGFSIRRPTMEDAQAVTDLIRACDILDRGESDMETVELVSDWQRSGFDLNQDAWVAVKILNGTEGPIEQVVGYEEVFNRSKAVLFSGDGYVHPDFHGLGIGSALLPLVEQRAREQIHLAETGKRVVVRNGVSGVDLTGHQLHQDHGYSPARYFWRMEIVMDHPPETPRWPDGIELSLFQPAEDPRPIFDAVHEAFRDHWGYVEWVFTDWQQRWFDDKFDPSLWYIARDGNEIAGAALCRLNVGDGWVSQLAVRRPWRRKGLGLALLLHALGEFYRRGLLRVGLGVDAQSPTGATRLYERAGMHVGHEYVVFEKTLRPGME
jgi:GNAT superfamily N-acetyltransferase